MNVNKKHVRFDVEIPGDAGHVEHRTKEILNAFSTLGIRVELRLNEGAWWSLADTEEPVDSSTVDGDRLQVLRHGYDVASAEARAGRRGLLDSPPEHLATPALDAVAAETCGIPACMHPRSAHRERKAGEPEPAAGRGPRKTADVPVLCNVEVAAGVPCRCPGFTPITRGRQVPPMSKPGPY